jgi:outer membrane protein, heavy metal efflux system
LNKEPQSKLRAMRRSHAWWLVALALFVPNGSQAGVALTVDRAIERALERNPEVLAARQELVVARGRLEKARYLNPFNAAIEGGGDERRFDQGGTVAEPSARLSIEVEVAGQRSKRIEEAERNLTRVEAEVVNVEREVRAKVAEAFYRVLYLRRRLELLSAVEDLNRRLNEASLERFKSGEVPKLEANLASVRYSQARKDSLAADRDRQNAVSELERLLGVEPLGTTEIAGELASRPVAVSEKELLDLAARERPDLRACEVEITRVDADIALTRRLMIPNPTFSGGYKEEGAEGGIKERIVGGQVSIPLPVFDHKQAELTELSGLRSRALHERDGVRLAVESEVREAFRSYETARQSVELFEKEAVSQVDESFGFIETAYRQGKIDLLQLIVAQNDLVAARLSYIDSLWDYWVARIALERAVGRPLPTGARP